MSVEINDPSVVTQKLTVNADGSINVNSAVIPRASIGAQTTAIASSTSETTIVTAGASGIFNDITCLQITNATAATPVTVTIKDATSGTTRKVYDLAGGGGIVVPFPVPLSQSASANNWTATLSVNTVTVHVNVDFLIRTV